MERDGQAVRDFARLKFGGAHLADPDRQWAGDITAKVLGGLAGVGRDSRLAAEAARPLIDRSPQRARNSPIARLRKPASAATRLVAAWWPCADGIST